MIDCQVVDPDVKGFPGFSCNLDVGTGVVGFIVEVNFTSYMTAMFQD